MRDEVEIRVTVFHHRDATVAKAEIGYVDIRGRYRARDEATGAAKRAPGDANDEEIANNLAVGRALEELGVSLQLKGNLQVLLATTIQQKAAEARVERKLKRQIKKPLLPLDQLYEDHGIQAVETAALRRGIDDWTPPETRHGKHERPEP